MNKIIDHKAFNITSLKFRDVSSTLLNSTNDVEADRALKKFLHFINNETLIYDFIAKHNTTTFDMIEITKARGYHDKFDIPLDDSEEVAFIYQLLQYVCENNIRYSSIAFGYGTSNKYRDMIREFNREVTQILYSRINRYLRELEIGMGLNEKQGGIVINQGSNGQLIMAKHGNVQATQNNTTSSNEELLTVIQSLITELKTNPVGDTALQEDILDDLQDIADATQNGEQPRKSLIRRGLEKMKLINEVSKEGSTLALNAQRVMTYLDQLQIPM
ncbi:hypothetical protein [Ureibacillus manganicus]|uniref:Uncharacterized protein n=1 Tax=Ureibacillus manganicus DSM 26584 TaxID=1384049 RepID=A0A0A3HP49_9BACL|nr:hypothetical protein [Ureibacillus manganicus]KGR74301.1 hypothetical protein CD29_18925 [Ureibacillus manganicus DSM 26584]